MRKKAQIQSNVIMWLGIIIAVLIMVYWLIPRLNPYHIDLEKINIDVEKIQGSINAACSSIYYRYKYNPTVNKGIFIVNDSEICINSTFMLCRMVLCSTNQSIRFNLDNITYIVIEKNETFNIYTL